MFAAMRIVCRRLGMELKDIAGGPTAPRARATALANASGFRVREVTLGGDWWLLDNGPLLAFRAEDETPLVLMPGNGRNYRAIDPANGVETPVDSALAATLKPFAMAFCVVNRISPLG